MWVYAFVFASKTPPSTIDDMAWTKRAQGDLRVGATPSATPCSTTRKIPDSGPDGAVAARRHRRPGHRHHRGAMIDEIVAVRPTGAQDQQLVGEWEGYYRTYIQDRHATGGCAPAGRAGSTRPSSRTSRRSRFRSTTSPCRTTCRLRRPRATLEL